MTKDIWINLPVKDIGKSKAFFKELGFAFNPMHENDPNLACLVVGDKGVIVMLFPDEAFKSFTQQSISDTQKGAEVLFSISAETKDEVDAIAKKAVAAGGLLYAGPGEKDGWMYGCGFSDLDGHRWNVLYMDMSKMPAM